jgi:RNA polymerase sigma-70 factor (ECF subfamily)
MWYSKEMPRLFNYVAYLVKDRALAEDLTAAICEKALERLHQYDARRGTLDAWMFAIARNSVRNYWRDQQRGMLGTSLELLPQVQAQGGSPEEIAEAADLFRQIVTHLDELTEQEQEVIALKYGADVSHADIAKVLGLTANHVGVIAHRALQKLRNRLKESTPSEGKRQ